MEQTDQGVVLKIKVIPKASQNAIVGWENGELKIRLKAVPEKGQANKELIRFLSKTFKIPQSQIVLLQGETSRHKKLCLLGKKISDIFQEPEDRHNDG